MRDRRLLHYFPLMITERYLERILGSVDGEVDNVSTENDGRSDR